MASEQGTVGILNPALPEQLGGNRVTAQRWADMLRRLGREVFVEREWSGRACDVLIALHAKKSGSSIARFAAERPRGALIVAGTGTDVYGTESERGLESMRLADRIVVLQELALDRLPEDLRSRARVIHQSALPPNEQPTPREDVLEILTIANLRAVKDPLLPARAVRRLPVESRIAAVLVGAAEDEALRAEAEREAKANPRFTWLGGRPHDETRALLARARCLVVPSRDEGGANVVSEALAADVPVIATRIDGSVGLLGMDHPGFFPVGDEAVLTALLTRFESDPAFRAELAERGRARAWIAAPERELEAWRTLLAELEAETEGVRWS